MENVVIKPQTPLSVLLYNHVCGSVVQLVVQNYKISSGSWKSHTHTGYGFFTYWSQTYTPLRRSKWKFFNLVLFFNYLGTPDGFKNFWLSVLTIPSSSKNIFWNSSSDKSLIRNWS